MPTSPKQHTDGDSDREPGHHLTELDDPGTVRESRDLHRDQTRAPDRHTDPGPLSPDSFVRHADAQAVALEQSNYQADRRRHHQALWLRRNPNHRCHDDHAADLEPKT